MDVVGLLEDAVDVLRQAHEAVDDLHAVGNRQVVEAPPYQRHHGQDAALAGEDLGRRHADFRPAVVVNARLGHAADGRSHHVYQPQQQRPLAFRLAHGRQGIGRFAGLADGQHHGAGADAGLAVAHFAGDLDLYGEICQLLEHVSGVQTGVVAGAAGNDHQVLRPLHALFEHVVEAAEVGHALALHQAPAGGVGNRFGLLEYLLERVVRKALQVGVVGMPLDLFGVALHLLPGQRVDVETLGRDADDVVVFQIDHPIGQAQKGGDVAGDEHFVFPDADHHGRTAPRRHQLARVLRVHHHQSVGAGDLPQGVFHGVNEIPFVGLVDEMGEDFGIRLGGEAVAAAGELRAQALVVFDDAVVDEHDRAVAVGVRMGVGFAGLAVGGPTGVADADGSLEVLLRQPRRQPFHFAGYADTAHLILLDDGDTGRVVTPVFEPPQSLDEYWRGGLVSDVADDAAHGWSPKGNARGLWPANGVRRASGYNKTPVASTTPI